MAIDIKSIPVLKNEAADKFVKKAEENYSNKASIDFSQQAKSAEKILSKSKERAK